jgi:tetratricopeptide (TPR) repeat protein
MKEDRIVFLEVPESLRGRIESLTRPHHHETEEEEPFPEEGRGEEFSLDPAIPIPVQLTPENSGLEDLSWEMILGGMIRIIAAASRAGPEGLPEAPAVKPEWIGYYRRFVLALKPEIQRELTEAAILLAKNGDFDQALEIFSDLEGLSPGSPTTLLNRALVLEHKAAAREQAGRETPAENRELRRAWERVLALDPPFANGLFNAGFFFLKDRDFRRARECFSRYLPLADDPEKKAEAESIIGEITGKALEDESFREAWERIRDGKEPEGLELIRDFLERHPGVQNGWFVLGWGLRRLGRWEDGAAALRKALELGSAEEETANAADILNELAICLMEQNDLPGARKELETALRLEPGNIKIISNLGVLALKTGDKNEAAGFFRTVLELSPDDPVAREYFKI